MNSARIDLFAEDQAHERLLDPIVKRIAKAESIGVNIRVRCARGGHGRAIREFEVYQAVAEQVGSSEGLPDLVIVGIDGNCRTFASKRDDIRAATRRTFLDRLVIACPDPHIERWYMADPQSFTKVVGTTPTLGTKKCDRDHYKDTLAKTVRQAGHPATLKGIEFAEELVDALDLYRAAKNDRSLKAFLDDLRPALRMLRQRRIAR